MIGWDLNTKCCGWAAGDPPDLPTAGAFRLFERSDLGKLGGEFRARVLEIHRRFPADRWLVEAPLLMRHDSLDTLERQYGIQFLLHTLANSLGIVCEKVPWEEVKLELGGKKVNGAWPDKEAQAKAAERMGVRLPATMADGRGDAADGVGVWKVGVRRHFRSQLEPYDRRIYSYRGVML